MFIFSLSMFADTTVLLTVNLFRKFLFPTLVYQDGHICLFKIHIIFYILVITYNVHGRRYIFFSELRKEEVNLHE